MDALAQRADVETAMQTAIDDYVAAHGHPSAREAREFLDKFTEWLRTTRRALYDRALAASIGAFWVLNRTEFVDGADDASATDADDSTDSASADERYSRVAAALTEFVRSALIYVPRKVGARVNVAGAFRCWLRDNDVALLASIGDDDYLVHWAVATFEHE